MGWQDAPVVEEGGEVGEVAQPAWMSAPPVDSTEEVAQPTAKVTSVSKPEGNNVRDLVGSTASLIDLPLSFPGALVGVGASLGATLIGAAAKPWTRESWGSIYKSALETGSGVSETLINPMQKVLKAFGVEKEYENAPVTQAMNFVSEKIAEGSDSLEGKTGIPSAGLQILANEILTLGVPGVGSATKRGVMKLNDFVQDAAAAKKATKAQIPRESVDDILQGYRRTAGESAGTPEVSAYRQPDVFRILPDDAKLNAATKADMFMQEGASKKVTEAAIAKNETLASAMEQIRARRADAKESFGRGVQQGEWLGPEIPVVDFAPGTPAWEARTKPVILGSSEAEGAQRLLAASKADPNAFERGNADSQLLVALGLASGVAAVAGLYPEEAKKVAGGLALGGALLTTAGKIPDFGPVRTLGGELARGKYTLKTLERLPQNRTEIPKRLIEQEMRRADIPKAEKDVLEGVLAGKGEQVSAGELVRDFRLATGDYTLEAKGTGEYADYGLEGIGRDNARLASPDLHPDIPAATTTLYRLPEHMELSDANHFNDPRLFGWTRSFDEGGIKHVVEIQSDLAQKAGKTLTEGERAKLVEEAAKVADEIKALNKERGAFPEDKYGNPITTREFRIRDDAANLRQNEIRTALRAGAVSSQVGPMLKHWPRRLIREELNRTVTEASERAKASPDIIADLEGKLAWADDLAKNGGYGKEGWTREDLQRYQNDITARLEAERGIAAGRTDVVRFADADTVAKVEGWAREGRSAETGEPQPFIDPGHQSIYNRYKSDIETYLKGLGGKHIEDAQGHGWWEVPTREHKGRVQQYGRIDQDLLLKAGIISTGLMAGGFLADDHIRGAFLGGLVGLGLGFLPKSSIARGIEYTGGITSTRIANISKPLWHRAVALELGLFDKTHKALAAGDPFLEKMNKLPEDSKKALNSALLRNDFSVVEQVLRNSENPQFAKDWVATRNILDSLGKELTQAGILPHMREDYFPRMVADREGLLAQMGLEQKTKLQEKLAKAEAAALRRGELELSPEEASSIINTFMQQGGLGGGRKPSFIQHRKIENLTPEMEEFYYSPTESFHTYVRTAVKELEKARFFGKDTVRVEHNGKQRLDIEQSIGQLIERELRQKNITQDQVPELASLLRSRFIGGERVPSKFVQDAKNYGNILLLGDLTSGLVQSGDAIMSVYQTGLRPTLKAVVQQITGKQQISMKDFGLADHISEEFVGTRKSAKILNLILKPVFSKIDAFGKTTVLNATINYAQRLVQTEAGVTKLGEKYAAAFGDDFPRLVSDLKSKQITPQVKLFAFHELSDLQPVSKLEMPQGYLDNPNGRIMYMLKSYQLKQFDILRRDAYQKIKDGDILKGIGNLTKLGITLGIAGATMSQVRSWILGIDDPLKASDVWDNALKTYGWSSFIQDKVQAGKPAEAVAGLVAPPYKVMDTLIQQDPKAVTYIPWFGKTIYYRGMGGAEKAEVAKARREVAERNLKMRRELYGNTK